MMMSFLGGLMILVLAGSVATAPPCDSALQYIEAFRQCLNLDFESDVSFSTFFASVYYQIVKDHFNVSAIPDAYSHIVGDVDGTIACGEGIEQLRTCGEDKFSGCSQALRDTVDTSINNYRDGYCELSGGQWQFSELAKSYFVEIGEFFDASGEDGPTGDYACVTAAFASGLWEEEAENDSCTYEVKRYEDYRAMTPFQEAQDTLAGLGLDVFKCIIQNVKRQGCSEDALRTMLGYYVTFAISPGIDFTFQDLEELLGTTEVPDEEIRGTAVVFGDPHMIVYNGHSYRFMTCSGVGERLYLRSSYVEIYGENSPISGADGSLPPTFMTEISIMFKDAAGDVFATYNSTQTASLPTTFIGGQSQVNEGSYKATVEALSSGIIRVSYDRGGVVVAIRQVSNTLTVTARMSQSVFRSSTGDLATGCPDSEITRDTVVVRKRRDASVCNDLNLDENYKEGCMFDVEQTGNATFVTEFYTDIQQVEEAVEEVDDLYIRETSDAAPSLQHSTTLLVLLMAAAMAMMFCN